ncbi:MAG: c-type cytochrome [Anaerolineales bacterium]|nr:MAG: c-type cytochrome [Anaerolineales bacterium]
MKKILKWIGIVLGSLIGLLLVVVTVMFLMGESRFNKTYEFPPSDIVLPTDEASLELGKHRVESLCAGCHGPDLGGVENWFDSPPLGIIDSANLTSGKGGIGTTYTDQDFVSAIRHGIDSQGKPIFMPAVVATAYLSNEELGAIIAYIRTLPPVDRELKGERLSPVAKILLTAGMLGDLPVEIVPHETQITAPLAGASVEYGKYMVDTHDCRVCHGPNLNGGPFPDPTIPVISPNITPGGSIANWTEQDFINTIRTGIKPDGYGMNPSLMPWKDHAKFYDHELQAIYIYLKSLDALPQYTK